jgi:hypothetical protein
MSNNFSHFFSCDFGRCFPLQEQQSANPIQEGIPCTLV